MCVRQISQNFELWAPARRRYENHPLNSVLGPGRFWKKTQKKHWVIYASSKHAALKVLVLYVISQLRRPKKFAFFTVSGQKNPEKDVESVNSTMSWWWWEYYHYYYQMAPTGMILAKLSSASQWKSPMSSLRDTKLQTIGMSQFLAHKPKHFWSLMSFFFFLFLTVSMAKWTGPEKLC